MEPAAHEKSRDLMRDTGACSLDGSLDDNPFGRTTRRPNRNAIIFDPQRRAAATELKTAIRVLATFLEQRELALRLRQRRRAAEAHAGFGLAVEALSCNLGGLLASASDWLLAIPRNSGAMWGNGRYRSPVYGQHFLDALEVMAHADIGLIDDIARGYGFAGSQPQRSTVRPTRRLLDHLPSHLLAWSAFKRDDDPEVLILKGRKDPTTGDADLIDYPETAATRRLRKQVQRINAYLRAAPLVVLPNETARTDDGQPIDFTRRTVHRIFNNESWEQGGRLYGAFWETMRREDRYRLLRIGTKACPKGEPIGNVDYGQLFTRLAYLEVGQTPPDDDLYDITGDGSCRDGWKQLLNAMLLTNRPLGNWPEGASKAFPSGMRLRDTVSAIRERHAPIAHLFGTGAGIRLMLKESEMLIASVLQLFRRGITALPLHDSVLCAVSDTSIAEGTMRAVFANLADGAHASLKTTFVP